jgi:putative membrane protein insertion efficiency factor
MRPSDRQEVEPARLDNVWTALDQCAKTLGLAIIRGYEYTVRPVLGPSCRFLPNCSEYARQALQSHGSVKGAYLSLRRLCRCHPFHPGGIDEVPAPASSHGTKPAEARVSKKNDREPAAS